MGLEVLDAETLKMLETFLIFGLSWIGFLFGLQFEFRQLKNLPKFYFSITAVQAFVTFSAVTAAMYLIIDKFVSLPESILFMAAITLGSTASCTAQSALAIVSRNYWFKNRTLLGLMRYISSVDGLFALCFFAVALCIIPGGDVEKFNFIKSIKWLLISATTALVPAVVLILLSRTRFTQQEYLVFLIGTIMFCGGLFYKIHHSPLVAGLICGIITANFCPHRIRALSVVIHAEKSIYIILLLMLGAAWQFSMDYSLVIAGIYFFVRTSGKLIGTFAATRIFKPEYTVPAGLGLGLISEGGLAVAIIINFKLLYPSFSDFLITILILSLFINELLSPKLILAQFSEFEPVSVKEH